MSNFLGYRIKATKLLSPAGQQDVEIGVGSGLEVGDDAVLSVDAVSVSVSGDTTVDNLTDTSLTASKVVLSDANKKLVSESTGITVADVTDSGLSASKVVLSDANKKLVSESAGITVADVIDSNLTGSRAVYTDANKKLVSAGAGTTVTALTVISSITIVNGLVTAIS